jgi:hypothetical protein
MSLHEVALLAALAVDRDEPGLIQLVGQPSPVGQQVATRSMLVIVPAPS